MGLLEGSGDLEIDLFSDLSTRETHNREPSAWLRRAEREAKHQQEKEEQERKEREELVSWGGALRGISSQFLSASEFLIFSFSLKSKVILSFRFGFSMSNLYIETPGEDF